MIGVHLSPRHARSASARYARGTPADAQAAQEAGLCTEVARHRQAGAPTARRSGSCASPADTIGASEKIIPPKLPSNHATTRTQDATVQVVSIRAAVSQHPFRRPQYLQPSTTSHLSVRTSDFQSRSSHPVARCGCHRMKLGSTSPTLSPRAVTVTTPLRSMAFSHRGSADDQLHHHRVGLICRRATVGSGEHRGWHQAIRLERTTNRCRCSTISASDRTGVAHRLSLGPNGAGSAR